MRRLQQAPMLADAGAPNVPRDFLELAATCLCHREPQRLSCCIGCCGASPMANDRC
jgi:hypothetical protein